MPEYNRDDLRSVIESRRKARRKVKAHQKLVQRWRKIVANRTQRIKNLSGRDKPARAVKFLLDRVGKTENNNRAPWLDPWSREIGEWMVGQPWCGLAVWKAAQHAGVVLDKRVVSTVYIRAAAQSGTGGFKAWHGPNATPRIGWVAIYGTTSSGPQHTGMYAGNGRVVEGNTSPSNSGSQANGGGIWIRTLGERRGWLLGWAEVDWS